MSKKNRLLIAIKTLLVCVFLFSFGYTIFCLFRALMESSRLGVGLSVLSASFFGTVSWIIGSIMLSLSSHQSWRTRFIFPLNVLIIYNSFLWGAIYFDFEIRAMDSSPSLWFVLFFAIVLFLWMSYRIFLTTHTQIAE